MPILRTPIRQDACVERLESAVAYDGLPISSGGAHGLGRVAPRDAFDRWIDFLTSRTVTAPIQSFFDFPQTPELEVDRKVRMRIESEFPATRSRSSVPPDRFEDALRLFESIEPQPTNQWGMAPVWLWFTADFQMRSPMNDALWPGQDPARFGNFETPGGVKLGASSTRLILQATRAIGLSLSIPLATDDDLAVVVPWLQAALPMRLSPKHWTRWTITKNGNSYRGRRIVGATTNR